MATFALHDVASWFKFFTDADIDNEDAQAYADMLVKNKITGKHLKMLNAEYLRMMGVTQLGDVFSILQHVETLLTSAQSNPMTTSTLDATPPTPVAATSWTIGGIQTPRSFDATIPYSSTVSLRPIDGIRTPRSFDATIPPSSELVDDVMTDFNINNMKDIALDRSQMDPAAQRLVAPNPFNPQAKFTNQVAMKIYVVAFDRIPICQFRDYVNNQKMFQWRYHSQLDKMVGDLDGIKDGSTKFGIGGNIHKFVYAEDVSIGVEESKNLVDGEVYLKKQINKYDQLLRELRVARGNLFDRNGDMRQSWKRQELVFITSTIDTADNYRKEAHHCLNRIGILQRNIGGKFSEKHVESVVASTVVKHTNKAAKRKKARLSVKMIEVLTMIAPDANREEGDADVKISKITCTSPPNFTTRAHLPALEALHEDGVFIDEAEDDVKGMLVKYRRIQQETTEKNLKKKDGNSNKVKKNPITGYFKLK